MTGMVTVLDVAAADAVLPPSPLITVPIASTASHHPSSVPSAPPIPLALLALAAVVFTGLGVGVRGRDLLVARRISHNRKDIR
jgi:hypothetical protein